MGLALFFYKHSLLVCLLYYRSLFANYDHQHQQFQHIHLHTTELTTNSALPNEWDTT